MIWFVVRQGCVILVAVALLVTMGCTARKGASSESGVTLNSPAALTNPPATIPDDVQVLAIEIMDGSFASDIYSVQPGPTRLIVSNHGKAQSLSIEGLVDPQQIAADATIQIGFTAPEPGRHTMHLDDSATAVLNVRPLGER